MSKIASKNVILITLDEVRADHLSCYGYNKIKTDNIDSIAKDGVLFETCITASNYTPVSHASIITGLYPTRHGVRRSFTALQATTIAEILKARGFATAGFMGNELMQREFNFDRGFDYFEDYASFIIDPLHGSFDVSKYVPTGPGIDPRQRVGGTKGMHGNWWIDRAINWIEEQTLKSKKFFIWGHCFETHRFGEKRMLFNGWIKPNELSEFDYYDAKLKCVDERFIGSLLNKLKELDIYDDTMIIVLSDHGTNLADHPLPFRTAVGWATGPYPDHCTLYEHDIRVVSIIKDKNLPTGKRVKEMVRTIDIVPTILDLLDIKVDFKFDGISLLPLIDSGESAIEEAYIESMWEDRMPGCLQALRTKRYKYIRNLTTGVEALYDLEEDPRETCNMLYNVDDFTLPPDELQKLVRKMSRKLNDMLKIAIPEKEVIMEEKDRKKLEERLRQLGYIE